MIPQVKRRSTVFSEDLNTVQKPDLGEPTQVSTHVILPLVRPL
jgi:hypothetical protein